MASVRQASGVPRPAKAGAAYVGWLWTLRLGTVISVAVGVVAAVVKLL